MHDKMMKMLMSKKKEGKTLSDSEKKSKLQALGGMRDMASQMMGDKLKNLKKVTVASDSKSGLKSGLHKAENLMDQMPEEEKLAEGGEVAKMPEEFDTDMDNVQKEHERDNEPRNFNEGGNTDEESDMHEASESPEEENQEQESMDKMVADSPNDPNDLDELIKKLEEKKQQLSKS